jgi:opacity protein-like surface antigen
MKKLPVSLLLLFGVLAFHADSFALIRLGVKAGINFASLSVSGSDTAFSVSYKRTPGFIGGVSADVAIAPSVSVRTELLYVNRSVKTDVKTNGGQTTVSSTLKWNEMALAPFLVIRYPLAGGVIPFLNAGPEFGLRTFLSKNEGGNGQTLDQTWKKNNFSVNVGAGIIFPVGPVGDITVDGRYNFGIVNLHSSGPTKARTNGIQFFVGYNFLKI